MKPAYTAALFALAAAGCQSARPPGTAALSAPDVSHVQRVAAAQVARAPREADYRGMRASRMLGRTVVDGAEHILGTIEDLVVDMNTGDVRYVVVASNGEPAGANLYALPVSRLHATDDYAFFTELDRALVSKAKRFSASEWPALEDRAFWGEVNRLSGAPAVQPANAPYAMRLTRLIGRAVADPQGRTVGRVADVVIDMSRQRVHYAALAFAPYVGIGTERVFAAPLSALTPHRGGPLVLDARYDNLAALAGFDAAHWPDLNDRTLLREVRRSFSVVFPPHTQQAVGATR
jgi:sporulation protein YlmC with PRC-barrel domain